MLIIITIDNYNYNRPGVTRLVRNETTPLNASCIINDRVRTRDYDDSLFLFELDGRTGRVKSGKRSAEKARSSSVQLRFEVHINTDSSIKFWWQSFLPSSGHHHHHNTRNNRAENNSSHVKLLQGNQDPITLLIRSMNRFIHHFFIDSVKEYVQFNLRCTLPGSCIDLALMYIANLI